MASNTKLKAERMRERRGRYRYGREKLYAQRPDLYVQVHNPHTHIVERPNGAYDMTAQEFRDVLELFLGRPVSQATLLDWAERGIGPPPTYVMGPYETQLVWYDMDEVEEWIEMSFECRKYRATNQRYEAEALEAKVGMLALPVNMQEAHNLRLYNPSYFENWPQGVKTNTQYRARRVMHRVFRSFFYEKGRKLSPIERITLSNLYHTLRNEHHLVKPIPKRNRVRQGGPYFTY
jgi:hypothetical protein